MHGGGCGAGHERWHAVKKSINSRNKGKVGELNAQKALYTATIETLSKEEDRLHPDSPGR